MLEDAADHAGSSGRVDQMFVCGGENVHPEEIEGAEGSERRHWETTAGRHILARMPSGRTLTPWLLAATVCFAFRGVCDAFFVQDDFWLLQAAQQPIPNRMWWRGALPDFLRPLSTYWFPFVGWHLFGGDPTGYHVLQLALFIAAVVVLQRVLSDLVGSALAAACGAAAFGLSWIHLAPLGWMAGATDAFALLCAGILLHTSLACARGHRSLPLAVLACALALLSKEAGAVLPVAIVGYVAVQCAIERRRPTAHERHLAAALLGSLLAFVAAWGLLILQRNAAPQSFAIDPGRTVHVLQDSLGALWPLGHHEPTVAPAWLLAPLLLAGVLTRHRRAPAALALLLWILPAAVFGVTAKPIGLQPTTRSSACSAWHCCSR